MNQELIFSEYDRGLLTLLTESNNRLAAALEANREEAGDVLYTCSQAAAYLGRDRSTISRMLADHRLHKEYRDGISGIRKSELDKYKTKSK